ncbi:MAG: hypothetical protein LBL94_05180 [Prevotellaceae bacterium]|nr:hypothetical protein [Prevotellaceae bacterium]
MDSDILTLCMLWRFLSMPYSAYDAVRCIFYFSGCRRYGDTPLSGRLKISPAIYYLAAATIWQLGKNNLIRLGACCRPPNMQ